MTKGYWVALVDVSDLTRIQGLHCRECQAAPYSVAAFWRGARKSTETPEGQTRSRVVVIEFPNYAAALNATAPRNAHKAMALREGKSVMDLTIVEGYDGPQPLDGKN